METTLDLSAKYADLKSLFGDVIDERTTDTRDLADFLDRITNDEDGDALDHVTDIDGAITEWDTGAASIWRIAIDGLVLYHHQDNGSAETTCVYDEDPGIVGYLRKWDHGDGDIATTCAEWGVNVDEDELDIADEDATDVRIWAEYQYYANHMGGKGSGYLRDDNGWDERRFATHADAQAWIDEQESELYYLSNGEHSRPKYYICN